MARLTVEDCIRRVANRFELVLLSAQRARELDHGAEATVDRDNDKDPVIALREIADGTVDLDIVRRKLIHGGSPPWISWRRTMSRSTVPSAISTSSAAS